MTTGASRELLNRDAVSSELSVLRALVRGESGHVQRIDLAQALDRLAGPSTLDDFSEGFGLTGFERSVLLLAAGPDLVGEVAEELAAQGGGDRLTFGTALALLPGAHWSAVTPPAPLRHWGLVQLLDPLSATRSPLAVDEWVLHHLAGARHLDGELAVSARPSPTAAWLPATLSFAAAQVVAAWQLNRPAVLHGPQRGNVCAVFGAAAGQIGLTGYSLAVADLPTDPHRRDDFLRRMERETVLGGCAWLVDLSDGQPDQVAAVARALSGIQAPVAVLVGDAAGELPWDAIDVGVRRLEVAERREVLSSALRRAGCRVAPAESDVTAGVFDLPLGDIEEVARDVADGTPLWSACRARTRSHLGALAAVVDPRAVWDDLVLPPAQVAQLRALASSVRHRSTVLDDWGFAARGARGLGSTALFAGPSGTGKTMAAEVLANDLQLDLLHVDLSQVVSKYIGETEKHLRRVFDAAEDGGSVLLFDEADALFGKRSEVHDSHDRYANIEVGYLLQRMEEFRGLAILTTNARSTLDQAFLRRLRTIVTFPYPDPALRERLWQGAFPAEAPSAGIEPRRLSEIDVPGGGIAAIALTAAYLAAEEGDDVDDTHILTAARWELAKSGRSGPARKGGGR